jgi:hypothetical protein
VIGQPHVPHTSLLLASATCVCTHVHTKLLLLLLLLSGSWVLTCYMST